MYFSAVASNCSYYSSVGTVSSYTYSYALYTSCGWWGRRRCRDGLAKFMWA